jgi:DMSO/TMAO reductase YedYZ heme-binding membrane subunit
MSLKWVLPEINSSIPKDIPIINGPNKSVYSIYWLVGFFNFIIDIILLITSFKSIPISYKRGGSSLDNYVVVLIFARSSLSKNIV